MINEQKKYEQEFETFLSREKHLALMVRSRVKKYGDKKVAVRHKPYGEWVSYTWAKFGEMIDATALGLLEFGVQEGGLVGIFSNNQVEWAVSDYAWFTLLSNPFTQETGEVTATGKLKRKVITERYKDVIESMYAS